MLKTGLNFRDINQVRRCLEAGYSYVEAARDVRCTVETVEKRFNEDGSDKTKYIPTEVVEEKKVTEKKGNADKD